MDLKIHPREHVIVLGPNQHTREQWFACPITFVTNLQKGLRPEKIMGMDDNQRNHGDNRRSQTAEAMFIKRLGRWSPPSNAQIIRKLPLPWLVCSRQKTRNVPLPEGSSPNMPLSRLVRIMSHIIQHACRPAMQVNLTSRWWRSAILHYQPEPFHLGDLSSRSSFCLEIHIPTFSM